MSEALYYKKIQIQHRHSIFVANVREPNKNYLARYSATEQRINYIDHTKEMLNICKKNVFDEIIITVRYFHHNSPNLIIP